MLTLTGTKVYAAVVRAADGVCFSVEAETTDGLIAPLADYVRRRCDHVLWPRHARQVQALIADGRLGPAIDLYFANVGDRWDLEELETIERDASFDPALR